MYKVFEPEILHATVDFRYHLRKIVRSILSSCFASVDIRNLALMLTFMCSKLRVDKPLCTVFELPNIESKSIPHFDSLTESVL